MTAAYRRALVIGLGASGRAGIDLLMQMGVQVHAYDRRASVDDPRQARSSSSGPTFLAPTRSKASTSWCSAPAFLPAHTAKRATTMLRGPPFTVS